MAWRGGAGLGSAGRGAARLGLAGHGKARQGKGKKEKGTRQGKKGDGNMATENGERTYRVSLIGESPLMMNRVIDVGGDSRKGEKDSPEPENVVKKAYRLPDGTLYQPAFTIHRAMLRAASSYKMPGGGRKAITPL